MIAAFVMTETLDCGPSPICCSERWSASSSGARLGELGIARSPGDQLDEPVEPVLPVPEVPLDFLEESGREPAQPLLRPELEDAVRLEAC